MTKKVDEEKEAEEVKADEGSDDTSAVAKPSSQKEPEFTREQEAEVTKRVSDELSKRGDKVKPLEERLGVLEADNVILRDKEFATEASRYGLEVDKLKEAGITKSSQIETYANLFGKVAEKHKVIPTVDSGDTSGGGEKTEQDKLDERFPTMKKK